MDLCKKKYFPTTDKCRTDVPPETKTRSFTLLDLTAAFFIFGVGISLSVLAFLIEMMINFVSRRIHDRTYFWFELIFLLILEKVAFK